MNKRRHLVGELVAILVLAATTFAANKTNPPTSEANFVRQTYAKLSFAQQLGLVHHYVASALKTDTQTLSEKVSQDALTFQISNMKIGNVTDPDVASAKFSDLVDPPSGLVLSVSPGGLNYTDLRTNTIHEASASVGGWHTNIEANPKWDMPFSQILQKMESGSFYHRYATFTVIASYQGRSRTYKAMFLFGQDNSGKLAVFPVDYILNVNGSALKDMIQTDVYPVVLMTTAFGDAPGVREWLVRQQSSDPDCKAGMCLDANAIQMHVPSADVSNRLAKPGFTRCAGAARPCSQDNPPPSIKLSPAWL